MDQSLATSSHVSLSAPLIEMDMPADVLCELPCRQARLVGNHDHVLGAPRWSKTAKEGL